MTLFFKRAQKALQSNNIDCWLIYVKKEMRSWILPKLNLEKAHISRPIFFLFYKDQDPVALFSELDAPALTPLQAAPLTQKSYFSYIEQRSSLQALLKGIKTLAIDYLEEGSLPSLSTIDAGLKEWLATLPSKLVSSSIFFDEVVAKVTEEGLLSHKKAAKALSEIVDDAFCFIESQKEEIYESDVMELITSLMEKKGLLPLTPIVAFGANSANPHYEPSNRGKKLNQGDVILIDLWSKLAAPHAIYADFTQVGYLSLDGGVPSKVREIFSVVSSAQRKVIEELQRLLPTSPVTGKDADRFARTLIESKDYGEYFRHRTGHNVGEECHGLGANLDSVEFPDPRRIFGEAIFTIEPGIYLPGEFGIRLECDIHISRDLKVEVTGGLQEGLRVLRRK